MATNTREEKRMSDHFNESEAAHRLSRSLGTEIPPRAISDLFYKRQLRDALCPIVGGRRLIPGDYLPSIREALRRRLPSRDGWREVSRAD
jgi:hypothetical protein